MRNEEILDTWQLLERVPVSRRTLAKWRAAGKLPYIKEGGVVLYVWGNVLAALKALQVWPVDAAAVADAGDTGLMEGLQE